MIDVLSEIGPLLSGDCPMELGPGTPNREAEPLLQELARDLSKKARDRNFALACLAGLWLYHDFLDESHAISQDLDTLEGSYWHGILHRREPDYWNAKYWFRRVPRHPIHGELCKEAAKVAVGRLAGAEFLTTQKSWNSEAFVDLCEAARAGDCVALCQRIQQCEWNLLFTYCCERAW